MVMQVIGEWAHIDGNLALILSNLLKTDFAVASAMYQALTGGEAKKMALAAAAKEALPNEDYLLLQAVLKVIKPSRDQRNEFAHYGWAWSDDVPDSFLLINPSVVVHQEVKWRDYVEKHKVPTKIVDGTVGYVLPLPPADAPDPRQIYVYDEATLKEAKESAQMAQLYVTQLWHVTRSSPYSAHTRQSLLALPQVQHWLAKWTSGNGP